MSKYLEEKNTGSKHLGVIDMDSDTTKTTDSSSNFEDHAYNDMGNDKDIYWD